MQAWAIVGGFGLDKLQRVERPAPRPGPGQVVVQVHAASLNYRDLLMVRGQYNPRQPLPLVPLSDGAGTVVEVGAGVHTVQVGDRVVGHFVQAWPAGAPTAAMLRDTLGGPHDGALQEQWLLPASGVAKIPDFLTFEQAATLPCAALTAWTALVDHGPLLPGQTVLVQGTGGVSLFALQFAQLAGARVVVTSSSDSKLARAMALGAEHGINYRAVPQWGKAVAAWSAGGVDHVVEVGGAGTLHQSLRAVKPGGHIAVIGVLSGGAAELNITPLLMNAVRMQGVLVGSHASFAAMTAAISHARLVPVIDRVFAWADAPEALAYLATGQHFGKVVLTMDATDNG